ncbi:hypothetical protein BOX15_Mlig026066g1, partial [Macrostomum lignano]
VRAILHLHINMSHFYFLLATVLQRLFCSHLASLSAFCKRQCSILPSQLVSLADSVFSQSDGNYKKAIATAAIPAALGAYVLYYWRQGRDLPPGPVGLPLIGRLPWTDPKNLHLTMQKVAEKYGDITSFYLGSRLFIVLNSYPMMKEMLDDYNFAGRPRLRLFLKLTRDCGIIFTEGYMWSQHRRLSLRTLRDFGFARAETVEMVDDQLDSIFQTLDEAATSVTPMEVLGTFILASNSIITEMTLGHRFERNDPEFQKVNKLIKKLLEEGIVQTASALFPAVERFIVLFPLSSSVVHDVEYLHSFIRKEIQQREKVMVDESTEPECLCDVYIHEKRKAEKAGNFETFKEFQLIRVILEFFLAGTDTTARSIEWLLLYMAFYPVVQNRVQNELDSVIGQSRRPRMQDRTELHYTSAVIDETYRKASLAAIGVFHRAVEETHFHGYRIPSDAFIIPNVYGVHHRAEYWERPNEFYPEHFLDDEGRYRSSPYLIPFLIGRRSCVGESLARMEIVLFFTAIMQRYRVRPAPESAAKKDDILSGWMGSLRIPGEYRLIFDRR